MRKPLHGFAMLINVTSRRRTPERMDDPSLPPAELDAALDGLARINAVTRSAAVLAKSLLPLARIMPNRPLRILDVATGGGDVPLGLERLARKQGVQFAIEACDVNPVAVDHAKRSAERTRSSVRFFAHDVLEAPLPAEYDAVVSSLFLHHMSDEEAVLALRRMAAAGRLVLVTDLARSRLNYLQVWFACHVLTLSRVNWHDGPASVRSAFTPVEAVDLARQAGLIDVTCSPRRPCRFLLAGRAA